MKELTFNDLWQLLLPSETFNTRGRYESCMARWNRWDAAKRARIYEQIAAAKQNGEFVHPNPCFAFDDAAQKDEMQQSKNAVLKRRQVMSFNDYYNKFGTTEETDGWKRVFKQEERTTIYVKS